MQAITNVGHNYVGHNHVRSHVPSGPLAPVVADVSLLHAGNRIGDAGLTQLAAALKINNAIKYLWLHGKLGGCDVLCVVAACML